MAQTVTTSSENRSKLYEAIPLKTPFAIHIFPAYMCNFKCFYCVHSLDEPALQNTLKKQLMSLETYKNAVDSANFSEKLKALIYAGHGEPLMNKNIAEMILYANKKDIAKRCELVTNGYLLTRDTSRDLIDAGLKSLRISIQGTTAAKYREISGVGIDFERLVSQIAWFYENKKQCGVYIKVVDASLDGKDDKRRFYELFDKYCDRIAVEHVVPTAIGVEYEEAAYETTQQGFAAGKVTVCPSPFYMLVVEPDGSVRPCCATEFPVNLGNVNETAITDIWQSNKLNCFWLMQLEGKRSAHSVCKSCTLPDYGVQPGDNIDSHAETLIACVKQRRENI